MTLGHLHLGLGMLSFTIIKKLSEKMRTDKISSSLPLQKLSRDAARHLSLFSKQETVAIQYYRSVSQYPTVSFPDMFRRISWFIVS